MAQPERGCTPMSVGNESTLSSIQMDQVSYSAETSVSMKAIQVADARAQGRVQTGGMVKKASTQVAGHVHGAAHSGSTGASATPLALHHNVMVSRDDPSVTSGGGAHSSTDSWARRKGGAQPGSKEKSRGGIILNLPVPTQIDLWRYSALYLLLCSGAVIVHVGLNKCAPQQGSLSVVDVILAFWTVLSFFLSCGAAVYSLWNETNHPIPFCICAFFLGVMYVLRVIATGTMAGVVAFIPAAFFMLESPIRFAVLPMTILVVVVGTLIEVNANMYNMLSDTFKPENSSMGKAICEDNVGYGIRVGLWVVYGLIPFIATIVLMACLRYGPVRESEVELAHHVLKYLAAGDTARARARIQRFVDARCPKCYKQLGSARGRSTVDVSNDHSMHSRFLGCEIVGVLEDAILNLEGHQEAARSGPVPPPRGSTSTAWAGSAGNPMNPPRVLIPSSSSHSKSSPRHHKHGGGGAAGSGQNVGNRSDSIDDINQLLSEFGALESDDTHRKAAAQSNPRKEEEHAMRRMGMTAGEGYVPNAGVTTGTATATLMHTNVIVLCGSLRGVRDSLRATTTGQITPRTLEEDYQSYCFQRVVSHCIHARGGYIHYLDGSEVVAFWGVHRALTSESFSSASGAALNIQRSTMSYNNELKKTDGDVSLHAPGCPYQMIVDVGISQGLADVDPNVAVPRGPVKETLQVGSLHVMTDVAQQAKCLANLSCKLVSTSILMDSKTAERVQMGYLTRWVESVRFVTSEPNPIYGSHGLHSRQDGVDSVNSSTNSAISIVALSATGSDRGSQRGHPHDGGITDLYQLIDAKGDEEWMYAIHNKGGSNRTVTQSNPNHRKDSVDISSPTGSGSSDGGLPRSGGSRENLGMMGGVGIVDGPEASSTKPETMNAIELFEKAMGLVYNKKQPLEAMELLRRVPNSVPFNNPKSAAAHQMVAAVDNSDEYIFEGPDAGGAAATKGDEHEIFPATFIDVPTRFLYRRCLHLSLQQKEYNEKQVAKKAAQGKPQRTAVRGAVATTNTTSTNINATSTGGSTTLPADEIPVTPIRLITSDADPIKAFPWEKEL